MRGVAGVLCLLTAIGAGLGAQSDQRRPNVVLIMTDDLGWSDLGAYGGADIRTPSIDSLARDGVRLTQFYSNGVLCSPTRAGLISGRWQQRYGFERALPHAGTVRSDFGLLATGRSLPQLLRTAGYATALVGKWHLGTRPEFSPLAHGFEYFFGLKAGYHDYYTHTDGGGNPDLWENDALVNVEGYTTDLITERAVSYIRASRGQPFFLEVTYNAPHWPYQPPNDPSRARDNGAHVMPYDADANPRADYVAMVERVDDGVGAILEALHARGLADNTLVIFTNDNGGEWLSNNAPLFNRKWTVWEGGIRVPAIVKWPGRVPAGRESHQVGITMDLTRSILNAAEADIPADADLEGLDLLPILSGLAPEVPRALFWRTAVGGVNQKAVRSGDWKLVLDGPHAMVFNVAADASERDDLTNRRQDVARQLRALLDAWEADIDAEAATLAVAPAGP